MFAPANTVTIPKPPKPPKPPKDRTASKRAAALKARLVEGGGKRTGINLTGAQVQKLDALVAAGKGANHSAVIIALINEAIL